MKTLLVNVADWDGPAPEDSPDGWLIANAPRPLAGPVTWTGEFRHGIFYAAAPAIREGTFGWEADDAWLVEFVTDEQIRARVVAHLAERGYPPLEELEAEGLTVAEIAGPSLGLPWHGGAR